MTAPRENSDQHRDESADAAPSESSDSSDSSDPDAELEPAFDIDLDPEDQGTAEAAAETSG